MANIRGGSRAGGSTVITRDNLMRFLLMVDGPGSKLDADTLDGLHAKDFASIGHNHDDIYLKLIGGTMKGPIEFKEGQSWFTGGNFATHMHNSDIKGINALIFENTIDSPSTEGILFPKAGKDNTSRNIADYDNLYAKDGKMYLNNTWALTNVMMGHNNGIDADTVDGKHASAFLLLTGGTMTGNINMSNCELNIQTDGKGVIFYGGGKIYKKPEGGLRIKAHHDSFGVVISNAQDEDLLIVKNSEILYKTYKMWHSGNQGHTSGMDADMVDGKHASDFATNNHNHDNIYLKLIGGSLTGALNIAQNKWWFANSEYGLNMRDSDIIGIGALIFRDVTVNGSQEGIFFPKSGNTGESTTLSDYDNVFALDGKLYLNSSWVLTNAMMGHGNGIDSDKLDGLHAESFFRTDRDNPYSLRFRGGNGFGIQFWNSELYSIYMSETQTGGRAPGETESDYNMYFKMSNNGGNRGFVFINGTVGVAGINSQGHMFLKKGITAGDNKFMIDYNEDTESIDFTIN